MTNIHKYQGFQQLCELNWSWDINVGVKWYWRASVRTQLPKNRALTFNELTMYQTQYHVIMKYAKNEKLRVSSSNSECVSERYWHWQLISYEILQFNSVSEQIKWKLLSK